MSKNETARKPVCFVLVWSGLACLTADGELLLASFPGFLQSAEEIKAGIGGRDWCDADVLGQSWIDTTTKIKGHD